MAVTTTATLRWRENLVFEGGGPGRPLTVVDGDSKLASSPVETLLLACASCTGADIVDILRKKRVALQRFDTHIIGTRQDEHPRRLTAVHFQFTVQGEGADDAKVRHAADLSLEKYCSVMNSLAPDIRVTYDVTIA